MWDINFYIQHFGIHYSNIKLGLNPELAKSGDSTKGMSSIGHFLSQLEVEYS